MTPSKVRANGVDFAYLQIGQGPLVLCLHGFPDTAWSFMSVLQLLSAAGYRAVAPFMRGYPPSGLAPSGDYRIIALGHDALALIDALGEQRAFLVEHNWGAAATYIAAALVPEEVEGIVTAAVPHLHRFLFWPTLRQLKRSCYMGFFQLHGILERRIVADDFKWLRALIREWSPGWNRSLAPGRVGSDGRTGDGHFGTSEGAGLLAHKCGDSRYVWVGEAAYTVDFRSPF